MAIQIPLQYCSNACHHCKDQVAFRLKTLGCNRLMSRQVLLLPDLVDIMPTECGHCEKIIFQTHTTVFTL